MFLKSRVYVKYLFPILCALQSVLFAFHLFFPSSGNQLIYLKVFVCRSQYGFHQLLFWVSKSLYWQSASFYKGTEIPRFCSIDPSTTSPQTHSPCLQDTPKPRNYTNSSRAILHWFAPLMSKTRRSSHPGGQRL